MSNNNHQIKSTDRRPVTTGGTAQATADRLPPPQNPKSNPSNIKK